MMGRGSFTPTQPSPIKGEGLLMQSASLNFSERDLAAAFLPLDGED